MTKEQLFNLIQIKANWDIVDDNNSFDCYNSGEVFKEIANNEIKIDEGATKFVLIPKGEDFVFKIGYEVNDDGIEMDNGCEIEATYYQYSLCDGLDEYFATTAFYDFITTPTGHKIPIYIQEKVEPLCERGSNCEGLTREEKDTMKSKVSSYYGGQRIDPCWIKDFIDCYGEEELECLMQFIDENSINDLHKGNIGYKDGKPIIFDYCGYESFS